MDNISLPYSVLAGLYKNSLVSSLEKKVIPQQEAETASIARDVPAVEFTGANNKNISILLKLTENRIPQIHLQFLSNLLKACRLSMEDVALVNNTHTVIQLPVIKQELHPEKVLLFGISPEELGLPVNFPFFKPQHYDAITYLYAPALPEINQDTEEGKLLKSKLWVCLKQVFNL